VAVRELIIGGDGFIGTALRRSLPEAVATTRRRDMVGPFLDLLEVRAVPACDVAYLCAGANGAKACEGSQAAFRVNVDAPIEIARLVAAGGGFTVFVSSMSVEWLSTAYQRHKLAAEGALRAMPAVGIVRAGRVVKTNLDELCETLIHVGRNRVAGVTRWGSDELAYQK
jgi:nucleoside-diphosphate-sugar epimerase